MKTKTKKTVKIVVDVLLWIFLVLSFAMTVLAYTSQSNGGIPKFGKTCILTVSSDSMAADSDFYEDKTWEINRGFKTGDLIVCKALSEDEKLQLKVGDVITFEADLGTFDERGKFINSSKDGNMEINTHRIIEIIPNAEFPSDTEFVTKGDNNGIQDGYTIKAKDIVAKWEGSKIGGLGKVIGFLQSSTGFLVCIVIPLALFFGYEIVILITTASKIKNKDKRKITKEDEEAIKQRAIEEYLAKKAQAESNGNVDSGVNTVETAVDTQSPSIDNSEKSE